MPTEIVGKLADASSLARTLLPTPFIGAQCGDDAAVWETPSEQVVVATLDVITPLIDGAFDFGRVAAAHALSDIYAMGARPQFALSLLGLPLERLGEEIAYEITRGAAHVCDAAGVVIAGGHSLDTLEPLFGLAAFGAASRDQIRRKSGANPGDTLVLTKAIGTGVLSVAARRGMLSDDEYASFLETLVQLNSIGGELGRHSEIHALTDITGNGLVGHLSEVASASAVALEVDFDAVPTLPGATALAEGGVANGPSRRNWSSAARKVSLTGAEHLDDAARTVVSDPQTNGGLLIACSPAFESVLLEMLLRSGFSAAAAIGRVSRGPPAVRFI